MYTHTAHHREASPQKYICLEQLQLEYIHVSNFRSKVPKKITISALSILEDHSFGPSTAGTLTQYEPKTDFISFTISFTSL